jgi:hypothetical protein
VANACSMAVLSAAGEVCVPQREMGRPSLPTSIFSKFQFRGGSDLLLTRKSYTTLFFAQHSLELGKQPASVRQRGFFTVLFEKSGKLAPLAWAKLAISAFEAGSCSPNWLHGNCRPQRARITSRYRSTGRLVVMHICHIFCLCVWRVAECQERPHRQHVEALAMIRGLQALQLRVVTLRHPSRARDVHHQRDQPRVLGQRRFLTS